MQFWPSVTCIQVTCFPENKVYLDYVKSVCKHTQCENLPVTYLFGPEHHWHHALGLRGLCALIDEDGAELHLSQARVTRTHTCAADHICILRNKGENKMFAGLCHGWADGSFVQRKKCSFFHRTLCVRANCRGKNAPHKNMPHFLRQRKRLKHYCAPQPAAFI